MSETITLDAAAVATGRTQLDITPWIKAPDGVNWGDSEIQSYVADQAVGSAPVDYRLPNRTVSIPLVLKDSGTLTFAQVRSQLQHKAALFQREGGYLMRTVGTTSLYADVVNATLHLGGDWVQAYGAGDTNATLQLECLPDFYGDEVTLSTVSGTANVTSVIADGTSVPVAGNYPGRVRVITSDTSAHDQHGLIWGFRARYYDSASTAALSYEGEALTALDAAGTFTHSGASAGVTMRHNSLPAQAWCPVVSTGNLTHKGSYRIWARVYSATATPTLRLAWDVGDLSSPTYNDQVQVPASAGFYIVDLGPVRLDASPVGTHRWAGVIQAYAQSQGDPVEIDKIWLQPLDESAGKLTAVQSSSTLGIFAVAAPTAGTADAANSGTRAWVSPTSVFTQDLTGANVTVDSINPLSEYLKVTGFGFAVPTGATISGITVDVVRKGDGTGRPFVDAQVRLVKAGTIQSPDKADTVTPWPTISYATKTYGGATDLWSGTWAPADINNANFGFAIAGTLPSGTSSRSGYIDFIKMTVYYTTSGGFAATPDAVIYASQTAEFRTEGMYRIDAGGSAYGPVSSVTGDLPRIPPSGLEGRPVQLFLKNSRGNLGAEADAGLDGMSVIVKYRPSYLFTGG